MVWNGNWLCGASSSLNIDPGLSLDSGSKMRLQELSCCVWFVSLLGLSGNLLQLKMEGHMPFRSMFKAASLYIALVISGESGEVFGSEQDKELF